MDNTILLENLNIGIDGISAGLGQMMCEASLVCLDSQKHKSGIELSVKTNKETKTFLVEWTSQIDENIQRSHRDENRTTDYGAMGISVLLALNLTEYRGLTVSQKGDGVDFWFETEEEMFAARL